MTVKYYIRSHHLRWLRSINISWRWGELGVCDCHISCRKKKKKSEQMRHLVFLSASCTLPLDSSCNMLWGDIWHMAQLSYAQTSLRWMPPFVTSKCQVRNHINGCMRSLCAFTNVSRVSSITSEITIGRKHKIDAGLSWTVKTILRYQKT